MEGQQLRLQAAGRFTIVSFYVLSTSWSILKLNKSTYLDPIGHKAIWLMALFRDIFRQLVLKIGILFLTFNQLKILKE